MQYWQVAAGSEGRDYSRDFLKYGIAFVGDEKHIQTINQVEKGDRIVLKSGTSVILAAGTVVERNGVWRGDAAKETTAAWDTESEAGVKMWLRDYDGWDLSGYCYVQWHKPAEPRTGVVGLTRTTIQHVWKSAIQQVADEIIATAPPCPVSPEPGPSEKLTDDELLEHLISEGLRPANAEELTQTLRRIRLLAKYYYRSEHFYWGDVGEHEARTFLIVPFLIALGWSEQQIKIELGITGGRIDIACFIKPYRTKDGGNRKDCRLILESKGFSKGLDYAHEQGKGYAAEFPSCEIVVASNGYCYKAYKRTPNKQTFETEPCAYLNLLRPRKQYPVNPNIPGGRRLLSYLLPQCLGEGP